VVFVDQYRPTIREQCLELVAGIVERVAEPRDAASSPADEQHGEVAPSEDREAYVDAGRRELREETGYAADDVHFVEEFWTATGVLRHRRGIVFAEGLTDVGSDLDDNEFLSVERVPVEDALAVARAPPANDATIEGLLLAAADGYL
jgi:ADP-ribose pyrophosphatase